MTLLVAAVASSSVWMIADAAVTGGDLSLRSKEFELKVVCSRDGHALLGFPGDHHDGVRLLIAHAKANGQERAYRGRKPSYSRKQLESARAMLGKAASVGEVARVTGLTRQTVYRIKDDPVGAEAALATWGV
jgi:hypothetical protein